MVPWTLWRCCGGRWRGGRRPRSRLHAAIATLQLPFTSMYPSNVSCQPDQRTGVTPRRHAGMLGADRGGPLPRGPAAVGVQRGGRPLHPLHLRRLWRQRQQLRQQAPLRGRMRQARAGARAQPGAPPATAFGASRSARSPRLKYISTVLGGVVKAHAQHAAPSLGYTAKH